MGNQSNYLCFLFEAKMASDDEEVTVYCICRQKYDGQRFMIECDVCKDWFHGRYILFLTNYFDFQH